MVSPTRTPAGRPPAAGPRAGVVVGTLMVAAALGVTTGVAVLDRQPDGSPPAAALVEPTAAASTLPTGTATPPPTPVSAPGAPVPVYVVGDTASGPRLYREYRRPAGPPQSPVRLALAELGAEPADPDYRTLWPDAEVTELTRAGTEVTVALSDPPGGAGGSDALAVQQVVYTVTAADPTVRRVRVSAPDLSAATSGVPLARAPQRTVLAPVWLLVPADGAVVPRRFTAGGTATVVEATVDLQVRRGTRMVRQTSATASVAAPGRGTWSVPLRLAPGRYELHAFETSAKDGRSRYLDTKQITVR